MTGLMRDWKYYSAVSFNDFEKYVKNVYGGASVTYNSDFPTTPLNSGQWGWDSVGGHAEFNDSSSVSGHVGLKIDHQLNIGDIIEVEAEFYCMTGAKPGIYVDKVVDGSTTSLASTLIGVWETVKMKYLVKEVGKYNVTVGTTTSQVATFRLRNVRIRVGSSVKNNTDQKYYRVAEIAKNANGSWGLLSSTGSDPCTVVVDSANKNIKVTFTEVLQNTKKGLLFINNTAYPSGNMYEARSFDVSLRGVCTIRFYKEGESAHIDPATLPTDTRIGLLYIVAYDTFL